jgi:membrane protease YdiL (CAAX protease family)
MPAVSKASNPWLVFGRAILFIAISAFLLTVCAPFFSRLPGWWSQIAVGSITSVATFGITMLFLRWDGLTLGDVGVALGRQSAVRLLIGFGIGAVLVVLRTSFVSLSGHVRWIHTSKANFGAIGFALFGYLLLAAREELAFRGYPLRRLEHSFGLWTAQLTVASIFALEHVAGGYTWTSAILGAFVGSLLFGMAAIATRGLALPIGLHAAWNFGEWVFGDKEGPGIWKPVVEPGFSFYVNGRGRIGYLLAFGAAMAAFLVYEQYRGRRQESDGTAAIRA